MAARCQRAGEPAPVPSTVGRNRRSARLCALKGHAARRQGGGLVANADHRDYLEPPVCRWFPGINQGGFAGRPSGLSARQRVWIMVGSLVRVCGAPPGIDGRCPHLLAVRDLASGQRLLWRPVDDVDGAAVRQALLSLFALHGAPLVLKTANGSPFGDGATERYLHGCGVIPLFSPPHTPRYNGSVEAGIGSLKTRTERPAPRGSRCRRARNA